MLILMRQTAPTRCMSASGGAVSLGASTQSASTRTRAVSPGSRARVTATMDPVTLNHIVHSIHPRAAARADPKAPEKPPGTRRANLNLRARVMGPPGRAGWRSSIAFSRKCKSVVTPRVRLCAHCLLHAKRVNVGLRVESVPCDRFLCQHVCHPSILLMPLQNV